MYTGPKLTNDNLVFGYDAGYKADGVNLSSGRFYKGPPHTNLVEEIDPSYGATNTTNFFMNGGATEEVDIPQVGKRNVQYVEYFNNRYAADGSVNSGTTCCPNLFHYFVSSAPYIAVDSSSSYTYSIIYKHSDNYHHPNFMYHYQKNSSGTTLTEGGVSSTNSDRRTHLGDDWYHAWGNIATQSTCTNVLLYSFLYNYGTVKHKYYVAAVSFVKNTTGETYMKIPPHLMLDPLASVSNTASLIDLKRTNNINVSNISFDSTGQPFLDGTDDEIDITFPTLSSSHGSIEVIAARKDTTTNSFIFGAVGASTNRYYLRHAGSTSYDACRGNPLANASFGVLTQDKLYHLVMTWDASTVYAYTNGVFSASSSYTNPGSDITGGNIGQGSGNHVNADLPVFKIYNKTLTAAEIKSNYNAYKNRFNL